MSSNSAAGRLGGRLIPAPETASVSEVTQLLQDWEALPRDGTVVEGDQIIAILEKLADIVERETDNFFKQVCQVQ